MFTKRYIPKILDSTISAMCGRPLPALQVVQLPKGYTTKMAVLLAPEQTDWHFHKRRCFETLPTFYPRSGAHLKGIVT